MIHVENLSVHYDEIMALQDISLDIECRRMCFDYRTFWLR